MTHPVTSSVRTPDGRDLEVRVSGSQGGLPLVYHHGTPSAAVPFPLLEDAATTRGLSLVSYSRPGYGTSSPAPGRSVAAAAQDVASILDQLSLDRFVTLGWSGGGPHALVCAALSSGRCAAAATLAGVAPYDAEGLDFLEGMAPENHAEFGAALEGRDALERFLHEQAPATFSLTGAQVAEGMGELVSEVDKRALTGDVSGDLAGALAAMFRHAGQQGIGGWRDDDLAFTRSWGFDLDDIDVPVSVWQGAQDRMVPFSHGQWLAAHVPGSAAHLYDDEGHVSLVMQVGRVLDDLVARARVD
jgi:pimeloyl-ACP methyl ester carboxylesterase